MSTQLRHETISTGEDLVNLYTYAASLESKSADEILDILSLGEQVVGETVKVEEIDYRNLANRQERSYPITHFNAVTRAGLRDAEALGAASTPKRHNGRPYIQSSSMFRSPASFQGRIAEADPTTPFLILQPTLRRYPFAYLIKDRWWARMYEEESLIPLVKIEFL